uniref:Uncharacterized protein n=1 Tax=Anopheles triannulatus TaxID=58253 RepID=A0A2M4AWM4_9DIPT
MDLGDKRPSELYADMRHAANNALSEAVLQDLWASRLPAHAQSAVIAFRGTVAEKMAVADAIMDSLNLRGMNAGGPSRVHTVTAPPNPEIAELRQMVRDLARSVAKLSTEQSHRRSGSWSRHRYNSRSRDRQTTTTVEPSATVCYYHRRWGQEARKCYPPCSYTPTPTGPNTKQ